MATPNVRLPRAPGPGPMAVDGAVWDRLCDIIEMLSRWTTGGGLQISAGQAGMRVIVTPPNDWFFASITGNQLSNYSGKTSTAPNYFYSFVEVYPTLDPASANNVGIIWVTMASGRTDAPDGNAFSTPLIGTSTASSSTSNGPAFPVSELPFVPLANGTVVLAREYVDQVTGIAGYAFVSLAQPPDVVVLVGSGISSAGGKYDGTIYSGVMNDSGTGNLSLPDGLVSGASCLVLNLDEQNQPTAWLETATYAQGVYRGMSTESPPRPIVVIDRGVYRIASPSTLSCPAPNIDSAATDTWDRKRLTAGNQYGDALSMQVVTRMGYNPADTVPVLGWFYRIKTYAADGRLDTVSAETFVAANTPDSCSS